MAFVPAPGYQPAYNPPIPYTTVIAGGLRVGMAVCVQATLPSHYNRFSINFATGQEEGADIACHMSARYDGRDRVVFNSQQNGTWGEEEMKRDMPFKHGKVFLVMFEVTRNNFLGKNLFCLKLLSDITGITDVSDNLQRCSILLLTKRARCPDCFLYVSANGSPFYEFAHHMPLERVQWLQVSGDITVQALSIIGSGPGVKGSLVISAAQAQLPPMLGPPFINPSVPFSANIRGGMVPKRTVVLKGFVKSNAKSFQINFKAGFSNDIALHINPRINKSIVVRNGFVNGTWGEEEKALTKNPFKEGEYFDMSVRSGEKHFKVFVNGSHCFDFNNRLPNLQHVDTLEVDGDVKLACVFF